MGTMLSQGTLETGNWEEDGLGRGVLTGAVVFQPTPTSPSKGKSIHRLPTTGPALTASTFLSPQAQENFLSPFCPDGGTSIPSASKDLEGKS